MFANFRSFVIARFSASPTIKKFYGDVDSYLPAYVRAYGFRAWFETLRGRELSWPFIRRLGFQYVDLLQVEPSRIPVLLNSLANEYNITLPEKEKPQLLTVDFWESLIQAREDARSVA